MAYWRKYKDFEWRTTRIVSGKNGLTPKGSVSLQVKWEGHIMQMVVDSKQSNEDFEFLATWMRLGCPDGSEYKSLNFIKRLWLWIKSLFK